MYLPVRTANAIVTAFGNKEFISYLKSPQIESGDEALQREAVRATALESLEGTAIGAFLRGEGFRGVVDSRRPVTEKQQTVFGPITSPSLANAPFEGAQKVLSIYAQRIYDAIQKDGFYVRVPSGKQFYLYVIQTIDRADATVAGSTKALAEEALVEQGGVR